MASHSGQDRARPKRERLKRHGSAECIRAYAFAVKKRPKKSSASLQLLKDLNSIACVSSALIILINIFSRFTLKIVIFLIFHR